MKPIKLTEPYPCPAEKAYEISINGYDGVVKYLPNIDRLEMLSEEIISEGVVKRRFLFHAKSPIPKIAQGIFKPEMLQWEQEMVLHHRELSLDWKIIPKYYAEHIYCGGTTEFVSEGENSRVVLNGKLKLDPIPMLGLPEAVSLQIIKVIEPFIVKMIKPNLRKFYRSIIKMAKEDGRL